MDESNEKDMQLRDVWRGLFPVVVLIVAPYIVALIVSPDGRFFAGALTNPDDLSVYLSAMRQGAAGRWLFRFTFSPEPVPTAQLHLLYILAGKICDIVSDAFVLWFHVLRVALSIGLLAVLLFWVRLVLPRKARWQRTAWQLMVFGSGLGWLTALLFPADLSLMPDLRMVEWTVFGSMLSTPHFVLGLCCEIAFFYCLLRIVRGERVLRWVAGGALAMAVLGQVYVFIIPIVLLVTGIFLLAWALQRREILWRQCFYGALILAPAIWYLFYYGILTRRDPYWEAAQVAQNVIPPPPPLGLVIGCGLVGILALVGVRRWFQHSNSPLVPIWAVSNILALYLPFTFSGRFALGFFVPLSILAAVGLEESALPRLRETRFYTLFSRLTPTPYDSLRRVIIILASASTLVGMVGPIRHLVGEMRDFPFYLPEAERRAARWLAENTDEGALVFAYYPIGNYLPRMVEGKVFLGQLFLTIDLDDKIDLVQRFWSEDTPTAWRQQFLADWGITHVYQGVYERLIAEGDVVPPGSVVYQTDNVTIYKTGLP
jgi:hypothetical protein